MENSTGAPNTPINFFTGNQERYLTRSARVMIKFPITNENNTDEDEEEKETRGNNIGESRPDDSLPGDVANDLMNNGDIVKKDEFVFKGVVRDNNNNVLPDAVVKIYACYRDGVEKPIAYTYTDNEGVYLINIPAPGNFDELNGFVVRAGKCSLPAHEEIGGSVSATKPPQRSSIENNYRFLGRILSNRYKTIFDL